MFWVVARVLLRHLWSVFGTTATIWLHGFFGVVVMRLLGCPGWLPG